MGTFAWRSTGVKTEICNRTAAVPDGATNAYAHVESIGRVMLTALLWLVGLIGVGIIFIGLRFLLDPAAGAAGFGVPVPPSDAYAYLRAKGTRDVVAGLFLFAFLLLGWSRPLSILIGMGALIPVGDFIAVMAYTRGGARMPLLIHGGTALYMAAVAGLLWNTTQRSSP